VPNSRYLADRLRAHARLCRHIAEGMWSEERALELAQLSEECIRAADSIMTGGPGPDLEIAITRASVPSSDA
jgi:hypothetical protein